ncbi:MAG: 16S rRNA (cytosine(1402)-N(4))-methyltransferase RsmH [Bacilli bacterium]|nr:16S rRNA (cytosine(1402)-N(4))-methyltransferase RsmH [Acholeplasmataceae bacterium]MDY2901834.1 16S rRNA (cytosine(1402)-N(4))-methyltransferase RsmH [Bacilli bacterium]
MEEYNHIPVLLNETIEGLNIKPDGIYVDCTMGGAGHSKEILKRLNANGKLVCFDQDDYAIKRGTENLQKISDNFIVIKSNFVNLINELQKIGINKIDGALYDLGVSSYQLDIGERGFSYHINADLDMRMDTNQYLKAYDIVNFYEYDELCKIFYKYGEEKYSNLIAKKIVKERAIKPIETTQELSEIILSAVPNHVRRSGKHPAKKIFQALRIVVNDELNIFEKSLKDALNILNVNGRIAVITFHSLEDRICKTVFKNKVDIVVPKGIAIKEKDIKRTFKLVNTKVITATEQELSYNNRAHSAKLRIIERVSEGENSYVKF